MAIKPILFNTEMVKAILDGKKTQTRRLVKPHYHDGDAGFNVVTMAKTGAFCYIEYYDEDERSTERRMNPPYNVDDILWVRETWAPFCINKNTCRNVLLLHDCFCYKAGPDVCVDEFGCKWRPSIHMPKKAARLFLRVTDIRAERLQDITDADALKEGVPQNDDFPMNSLYCHVCHGEGIHGALHPATLGYMEVDCENCDTPVKRFLHLWNSTIKYDDVPRFGWEANPWVWVIEFERTEQQTPF